MNADLEFLAYHELAARSWLRQAVRHLGRALAPPQLARSAARSHPWAMLAVAGVGGAAVGAWLASATARSGAAPAARSWVHALTQVGRVAGTLLAATAKSHDPPDVQR